MFFFGCSIVMSSRAPNQPVSTVASMVAPPASVMASKYGVMVLFRSVMCVCTGVYLASIFPLSESVNKPLAALSGSAAFFHVWLTCEHTSGLSIRTAIGHCVAHNLASVLKAIRDAKVASTIEYAFYFFLIFPLITYALQRYRSAVRAHGREAASACVAVVFKAFWGGVIPALLFLGSDSLG